MTDSPELAWLRRAQWMVCSVCGVQRLTHQAATQACRDGEAHAWVDPEENA